MMHLGKRILPILLAGMVFAIAQAATTPGTAGAQPGAQPVAPAPTPMPAPAPMSAPAPMPAPVPMPAPAPAALAPGGEATRPNRPLLITGLVATGLGYGLSAGTAILYLALVYPFQAALSDDDTPYATPTWLAVPIAGPLIAAQSDFAKENPEVRTLFYIDATVQGAGIVLMLTSLVVREKTRSSDRVAERFWLLGPGPESSLGLSVMSSF